MKDPVGFSPFVPAWKLIKLPAGAIALIGVVFVFTYQPPAPKSPAPPIPAASMMPSPKPPPTKAELAKARAALDLAQAEFLLRLGMCSRIESNLLAEGYDVQVAPLSDDHRSMVVIGPGASRVMARQFAASGTGPALKKAGFARVVFMQGRYRWLGEWNLVDDTIRLSGG